MKAGGNHNNCGGCMAKKQKKGETAELVGFIGVGLDNQDEHQRITRADNFVLVGGSADTHERMQDTAIFFNEELEKRGKRLNQTEPQEAIDLLREAMDR